MASEYPKKYWWLILVVIPVAIAIIQVVPSIMPKRDTDSKTPAEKDSPKVDIQGKTDIKKEPTIIDIEIFPNRISMDVGESERLRAEVRNQQGEVQTNEPIQWESGNNSVAEVTSTGKVTGLKEGMILISAKSRSAIGTAEIIVRPIRVAEVKIVPNEYSIYVGSTVPLKAELRDRNGNVLDRLVKWSSRDLDIAGVTSTGVVKGIKFGIAGIVAECEGVQAEATIYVGNPQTGLFPVKGFVVTPKK